MKAIILTGNTITGQREYCGLAENLEYAKLLARDLVLYGGFYKSIELVQVDADGSESQSERVVITSSTSDNKVVQEHFGSLAEHEPLELGEFIVNHDNTRRCVVHEKPKKTSRRTARILHKEAKNKAETNVSVETIKTSDNIKVFAKKKSYSAKFLFIACILSALTGISITCVILALF